MKNFLLVKWLNNISIKRKLYFTVGIMALLIAFELYTLYFSISTLSAVRAYVQGESLYSKAQKDAVYHLYKYSVSRKESEYLSFKRLMSIPQADQQAREEIYKETPDLNIVRKALIQGRNHPQDIDRMIDLFNRFSDYPFLARAINLWTQADSVAASLSSVGENLHKEFHKRDPDEQVIAALTSKIHPLNIKLSRLEDSFSYTLGDGSRKAEKLIFTLLFLIALTVELTGLLLALLINRGISRGVNNIVEVSHSVARGDFTKRATVYSNDEIGKLAVAFNNMVSDLEHGKKERQDALKKETDYDMLRQAEKKFRTILECAPSAFIMIKKSGEVVLVNQQTEKLFGYTRSELIGKNSLSLVPELLKDKFPGFWKGLFSGQLNGQPSTSRELTGVDKSGKSFPIEIVVSPIETEDGIMALGSIVDITKRKQDENQLREAKERAEQLSQARQEFLSVMSHEMRTPLNAVVGITHLLMEDNLTSEQKENLNILHFSTQNLLALINNILDFSKIESGKLQLETIDFNLNTLVRRLLDSFRHSAQEKQLKLVLHKEIGIPELINGDPVRLTQVLTNLIHNAIKFTRHGEICLSIKTLTAVSENIVILFEITDTGIGIEADRLQEIFDSYTQAKPSITRQFGGTGLGLTICKKLINIMGGEIRVRSEINKGSTFSFHLTFPVPEVSEKKPAAPHNERDFNLKGIRVLLVEDNIINQVLAKKFISKWGATVDTAENGIVAIKKVNKNKYDIVLMDLQMPVMDGYKANRIIRELGFSIDKLPVIALSAYMLDEVKADVRSAGMNDFLSKPIDPHELYRIIVKNIKRKRRNEEESFLIEEPSNEIMTIRDLLETYDVSFRKEFLELLENEVKEFDINIHNAVMDRNTDAVKKLIHKITPSIKRFDKESLTPLLAILKYLLESNPAEESLASTMEQIKQECANILNHINSLKEQFFSV
jgi:PAS domain S-box-containing protein